MRTVLTHVLHVRSKGLRVAVWSRSIQLCTRRICGAWVLASQNAWLRSHAQRGGDHTETNIRWKSVKTTRKRCFEVSKKCGMFRGWCFIGRQIFKLEHIKRCELWKRQNQCWIVSNSNVTIQGGICLFHSSHLVMCFNLKFCVAIKHHPLNIPHFFETSKHLFLVVFTGFHRMLVFVWYPPATRTIWVLRSNWPEPKPHGS